MIPTMSLTLTTVGICVCLLHFLVCIYTPRWQLGGWRGPTTYHQHQQMNHNSPSGGRKEWLHLTATVFHIGFILFTVVMRYVTVLLIHFCVLSSGCNAYQIPVLMICPAVWGNYSWMWQGWRLSDCYYCEIGMTWHHISSFNAGPGGSKGTPPLPGSVRAKWRTTFVWKLTINSWSVVPAIEKAEKVAMHSKCWP